MDYPVLLCCRCTFAGIKRGAVTGACAGGAQLNWQVLRTSHMQQSSSQRVSLWTILSGCVAAASVGNGAVVRVRVCGRGANGQAGGAGACTKRHRKYSSS